MGNYLFLDTAEVLPPPQPLPQDLVADIQAMLDVLPSARFDCGRRQPKWPQIPTSESGFIPVTSGKDRKRNRNPKPKVTKGTLPAWVYVWYALDRVGAVSESVRVQAAADMRRIASGVVPSPPRSSWMEGNSFAAISYNI